MDKTGMCEYLILLDKDEDPVTIDWMSGGIVHKATQYDRITCFQSSDRKELDQIVRANMADLVRLNLGTGLHIGRMTAHYEVKPDVERAEDKLNRIGQNN